MLYGATLADFLLWGLLSASSSGTCDVWSAGGAADVRHICHETVQIAHPTPTPFPV
jgi:hypothetical protein